MNFVFYLTASFLKTKRRLESLKWDFKNQKRRFKILKRRFCSPKSHL